MEIYITTDGFHSRVEFQKCA